MADQREREITSVVPQHAVGTETGIQEIPVQEQVVNVRSSILGRSLSSEPCVLCGFQTRDFVVYLVI